MYVQNVKQKNDKKKHFRLHLLPMPTSYCYQYVISLPIIWFSNTYSTYTFYTIFLSSIFTFFYLPVYFNVKKIPFILLVIPISMQTYIHIYIYSYDIGEMIQKKIERLIGLKASRHFFYKDYIIKKKFYINSNKPTFVF